MEAKIDKNGVRHLYFSNAEVQMETKSEEFEELGLQYRAELDKLRRELEVKEGEIVTLRLGRYKAERERDELRVIIRDACWKLSGVTVAATDGTNLSALVVCVEERIKKLEDGKLV